jgi:hypothetical protein
MAFSGVIAAFRDPGKDNLLSPSEGTAFSGVVAALRDPSIKVLRGDRSPSSHGGLWDVEADKSAAPALLEDREDSIPDRAALHEYFTRL